MKQEFRVSIAVPIHNEMSVLPELLNRTLSVLDKIPGGPHELLFVDDGSTDQTLRIIEEAAQHDSRIVGISFSRNFGHQAALTAALNHVTGDVTVLMDGDLQDAPEVIPLFIEKSSEGCDVVYSQSPPRHKPSPLPLP